MKQLSMICLCVLFLLAASACATGSTSASGQESKPGAAAATTAEPTAESAAESTVAPESELAPYSELPVVMDQTEYVLYQNIFGQNGAETYLNKSAVKEGVLVRLTDAFNGVTRYYVWGYYDATKCCDWQWEFVPSDPDKLPPNGSRVRMTGTLVRDEAALDQLWFVDTTVELVTPYAPADCDVDMTCMDGTLERVQIMNMQYCPDAFQGKTLRMYGRVFSPNAIQDPYYNGSWTQELSTDDSLPAPGIMILVSGTWYSGTIQANTIAETDVY